MEKAKKTACLMYAAHYGIFIVLLLILAGFPTIQWAYAIPSVLVTLVVGCLLVTAISSRTKLLGINMSAYCHLAGCAVAALSVGIVASFWALLFGCFFPVAMGLVYYLFERRDVSRE